ncbi:TPA: hypothetical protein VDV55_005178 [Pseudomonas aeruginosa]|uniref:phospholipase D-like domain-containing protein n=2 Tax=Pseudomonas aeruginosa TaxID=287 RepID=UPI0009AF1D2B|nr:phospholipase D-like domain-containing protein [Pseudomonas aeruginosa]EKV0903074.1 hypothetical protein [Pseudomonas aeruginosa]KSQ76302.2 hypothetical protein APB44_14575 [Pseudomonas aeruginosa]RPU88320.1 hypothetical protein IPC877_14085 [Pseudomonas aeruginosa]WCW04367.1 hypothetical protein KK181_11395 [Pseudomonas aeruginosa]SUC99841.1 nuclease NucT [Pseudomonas aeruginosa]
MPRHDTFSGVTQLLANEMASLSASEARRLANDLTTRISNHLAGVNDQASEVLDRFIPLSLLNVEMLAAPWAAFRKTHETHLPAITREMIDVVCTLPAWMRLSAKARELCAQDGIWAGSLMQSIHELIDRATESLVIVAPYWSTAGVTMLLRHIQKRDRRRLVVTICTQPQESLDEDATAGICMLVNYLAKDGASVRVVCAPGDKADSLMHAKLVISDRREAYVGSANFSTRGVDHSVELGLRLEGRNVSQLNAWAEMLIAMLIPWDASGSASIDELELDQV